MRIATHYEVTTSIVYDISGPRKSFTTLIPKYSTFRSLRNRKKRFPAVKNFSKCEFVLLLILPDECHGREGGSDLNNEFIIIVFTSSNGFGSFAPNPPIGITFVSVGVAKSIRGSVLTRDNATRRCSPCNALGEQIPRPGAHGMNIQRAAECRGHTQLVELVSEQWNDRIELADGKHVDLA
ncbi:hypothetical protein PRIPAC_88580 [Pristionchus pacificus]|uniref:Uncharacterized protein n=1 Tax=Pristionchus pacificus TaxID=54126 RepID=A0A2A6CTG1_PRIPA|nr:hypothetical protein PRIPAC_88580 [Pristionchus pacificus]|eukprot:PDM81376.1 hypothetical protein PRIPAC_35252 [Pristionchus pacificus]